MTIEDLLQDQLAACVAATRDCLAHARVPRDGDSHGRARQAELDYIARLMKASTRLTTALVKLRGDTSRHTVHVTYEDANTGDRG